MVLKKIELELYFDDEFIPPKKFESWGRENDYNPKCKKCPFYGEDDVYDWCVLNPDTVMGECPIRKFFETEEKES